MAYITIPETDLDANSGLIEATALQITRNLEDHEARLLDVENTVGTTTWTAKTADYTLTTDDVDGNSNNGFNNDGASGAIKFTLPSAVSGMRVTIANAESQTLTIEASSGDGIYTEQANFATQIANNTKGSVIILYAINSSEWVAIHSNNWTASGRMLFTGGNVSGSDVATIQYVEIGTLGNASTFGNLAAASAYVAAVASGTRGVFNRDGNAGTTYVEYGTTGNSTSFGNLTASRTSVLNGSGGSSTRGVIAGGSSSTVMDYCTIASIGNFTSFGSLAAGTELMAGVCNGTRLVFGGGIEGGVTYTGSTKYITVASTGNATSFGSLTEARAFMSRCDNSTRGVYVAGTNASTSKTEMQYIDPASTSNTTTFGNLSTSARHGFAGSSSSTRGVFGGGSDNGGTYYNNIEYITIGTLGNSVTFGTLTALTRLIGGMANSHGGTNG
jgi:hypothetical protein